MSIQTTDDIKKKQRVTHPFRVTSKTNPFLRVKNTPGAYFPGAGKKLFLSMAD